MKHLIHIFLILILTVVVISACDKYNTDVIGEDFAPYNSLVTKYKQLVYVEYREGKAKVWGPYADLVNADVDGLNVKISSDLDSLVIFAYGSAMDEADTHRDASLSIDSRTSFAVYMSGLNLNSTSGVAFESLGEETCFLVLSTKSQNHLWGSLKTEGPLIIDGAGTLHIDTSDDALVAKGGVTCSYPVTINISSENGDGVRSDQGMVKIADGKWYVKAAGNAFYAKENVVLNGGQISGYAKEGSFVAAPDGAGLVTNSASCFGLGSQESALAPMLQYVWQDKVDNFAFIADSTITISRLDANDKATTVLKYTPPFSYSAPWVVISHSSIMEGDWIEFE